MNDQNTTMLNYLSESDNEDDGIMKGGGFNVSTNLLCPSTFIKLYKSEKQDLVNEKK